MRRCLTIAATWVMLLMGLVAALAQDEVPKRVPKVGLSSLKAKDIEKHLRHLASDELQGRRAGTASLRKSAQYIAGHFEKLQLQPGGEQDSYLPRSGTGETACAPAARATQVDQGYPLLEQLLCPLRADRLHSLNHVVTLVRARNEGVEDSLDRFRVGSGIHPRLLQTGEKALLVVLSS